MEVLKKFFSQRFFGAFVPMIFFITLVLSSCEKEANVDIPKTDPKPVLVCFLSPEDSFITVRLTNSIPLYSGSNNNYPLEISNANLLLSDGASSVVIPWYKDSIGYRISSTLFPIVAGKTYTLDVTIPDGRKLKASTKIPVHDFPEVNLSLQMQMTDSTEFLVTYDYSYEFTWLDFQGEGDYYRVILTSLFVDTLVSLDTTAQIVLELFESDKGRDNTEFKVFGNSKLVFEQSLPNPFERNVNLAYLILGNEDYYLYHKDLYESNDENPFSEAKINFSNIEGGIGCLGAYRMKRKRF